MRREILLALLFSFVVSLIFFSPILLGKIPFPGDNLVGHYQPYASNSYGGYGPGAVPNIAQGFDVILELIPWKYITIKSFKSGQIPYWDPYNFSGNPLLADFQSGIFYPLNILFFFLPFARAWTLFIFFQPVLFCFFTYLFLRQLRLSQLASAFGAITAAFSGYFTVWIEYGNVGHAFLWLPLELYFSEKLLQTRKIQYVAFLVAVFFISFMAGYIQAYFYCLVVFSFYFLVRCISAKQLSVKKVIVLLLILIIPVLLSSFQLLTTVKLFSASSRNNYSLSQIENLLNPWWYWVTGIVPNFFGHPAARNSWFYGTYIERVSYFGIIPFAFAVMSLKKIKTSLPVCFFAIIGILALIAATNLPFIKYLYLIPIPLLSTTVPTRVLSLFTFSGAVLSAFGMEYFLTEKKNKKFILISGAVFLFTVFLFVLTFVLPKFLPVTSENMSVAKRNLYIPILLSGTVFGVLGVLECIKNKKSEFKKIAFGVLFALTLVDFLYFFVRITPFAPLEYFYPTTGVFSFLKNNAGINRFWGYGSGTIEGNIATYEGIYSPEGIDPLHLKRYGALIATSDNGKVGLITRAESVISGGYGKDGIRNNPFRQRVLDIDGVKYILNKTDSETSAAIADYDTFPKDRYQFVYHTGQWQIYENKNIIPRFSLFSDYTVVPVEKILSTLQSYSFPYHSTLLLSSQLPADFHLKPDPSANVSLVSYQPNRVVLKTHSATDQILFLSDSYYSGWGAQVDSQNATIYPADYTFRAIPVHAGDHTVEFYYTHQAFTQGLTISLGTLLVSVLVYIWVYKKRYVV